MNNLEQIIAAQINESINTKQAVAAQLTQQIAAAAEIIVATLRSGNKILCCGNGGSASDAQHFAAELVGRYVNDRPALAALALNTDTSALTAIANDYGYNAVFSRQIEALGQPKDLLFAITTSGNSENIIAAVEAAKKRDMQIIALTGKGGGRLSAYLRPVDVHLCIPSNTTSRIQEAHILLIHMFCEIIDSMLLQG